MYYSKKSTRAKLRTKINTFNKNSSATIAKVLSRMKRSTYKGDKMAIKPIMEILTQKRKTKSMNNTDRVLDTPKRVTIFV